MTCRFVAALILLFWGVSPALPWFPRSSEEALLGGKGPAPLVGTNQRYFVDEGDSLIQLARSLGLGYEALAAANPDVEPWTPETGRQILLPYSTILAGKLRMGITINLAEYKLYLLWEEKGDIQVRIYPVGIGSTGWETPEGTFTVREKIARPGWTVPAAIRAERPGLPAQVPPGPDNPLGDYWIGFTERSHGIHGTNEPFGIGRRSSHGCIRLYPEDIRDLYARVTLGTPVHVIYQPIKVGVRDGALYLEAHRDYLGRFSDPLREVKRQALLLGWAEDLDRETMERILQDHRGIPLPLSTLAPRADLRADASL